MNPLRSGRLALNVLVAALLGACASGGGGGGGGGSPLPPPSPPATLTPGPPPLAAPPAPPLAPPGTTPDTASAEFTNNWGVGGIGAQYAWRHGATGAGVTVAVIDNGVDPSDPELAGRIDTVNSTDIVPGRNALTTSLSHGSELSSLIAGNFNGAKTVGVAYEATILAIRADNGQDSFNDGDLANALDYARTHGARVVNLSLGSAAKSSDAFRDALQRATAAGMIIVTSAGNDTTAAGEVNYPGFFANVPSVSNGLIIVAGALNQDGSINQRSNPPGQAQNFYLMAPGWQIIVPDYGPAGPVPNFQQCWPDRSVCNGLVEIQGTSYSSPLTAGAAALLMSAFPGLTPQQVVAILLSTTDDIGAAGTDSLAGRGRLNLQRAFEPIGTLSAPLSSGFSATAGLPLGAAGPAFGDGLTDDPGEWVVAGFDSYGRTYDLNLARNWLMAAGGPALSAEAPLLWRTERGEGGVTMQFAPADDVAPLSLRLPIARADIERPAMRVETDLAAGFRLGLATRGASASDADARGDEGLMGFVDADMSMRLSHKIGSSLSFAVTSQSGSARVGLAQDWSDRSGTSFETAYARGPFGVSATFGKIEESRGLLGFTWTDALGATPGADARFAGLAGHWDMSSRLRLRVEGETGKAELARSGWLALDQPLRTSAYSAELDYALALAWGEGDSGELAFSVRQPLRVEAGAFTADLPTADEYGRKSLAYEARRIDVAPSGREIQFGLNYRAFIGDVFSGYAEAVYVTEPGHVAAADDAALVRVGLRARY